MACQALKVDFDPDEVVLVQTIGRTRSHHHQHWLPTALSMETVEEIAAENAASSTDSSTSKHAPTRLVVPPAGSSRRGGARGGGGARSMRESSDASTATGTSDATADRPSMMEGDEPERFIRVIYLPRLSLSSSSTDSAAGDAADETESVTTTSRTATKKEARRVEERIFHSWEPIQRSLLMSAWKEISAHKHANVFMYSVDEKVVPGYYSIVRKPINLMGIKRAIDSGGIRTFGKLTDSIAQAS